jgi:hypothetical protein
MLLMAKLLILMTRDDLIFVKCVKLMESIDKSKNATNRPQKTMYILMHSFYALCMSFPSMLPMKAVEGIKCKCCNEVG